MRSVWWKGVAATTVAMAAYLAWAAPKSETAGTPVDAQRGGVTFAVKTVKITAPDTRKAPYPQQETTPGHGTLDASWPVARSEAPEWKQWNAAVLRVAQELVNGHPEDVRKPIHTGKDGWARGAIADQELGATAHVPQVRGDLVSTKIDEEMDMHGGAHPMEVWVYFHWLLKEGRELQAGDVFELGSDWQKVVARDCDAALRKQSMHTYLWSDDGEFTKGQYTKGLNDTVKTPRNWKIGPKGLTMVFPEYAVSPRVATPEDVTIAWSELKPYLAKGFTPPK